MTAQRRMYLNDKQLAFAKAKAPTRVWVGGRGSGKSHEIGVVKRKKMAVMPRSRGFLCSTTFNQIATKTWPGIAASWEIFGLIEGVHYVYGIQPPKHFEKPLSRVRNFGNVVSMRNGSIIEFLSMDRPDTARGGSFDHGDIDEAALVKREHWSKVLLPAVRGNLHRFHNTHWHQMVGMYTSMPWKSSGLWILDYEEKARREPEKYFYQTANAYDNIHILGESGIQRMRDEMTHLEFLMEVMNEKIVKTEDAFYDAFDVDIHCYQPKYLYGQDDHGRDVTERMLDVDPDRFLDASFDFGGWISCCSVYQEHTIERKQIERMVAAFHVKGEEKIPDLVRKFCTRFAEHKHKYVRLWGEPHGHDKNSFMNDSAYEFLKKEFIKLGWRVEICAPSTTSRKTANRQLYMSTIMGERTRGYPTLRVNQETCKAAIVSIQGAQKLSDGSKDKSLEKDKAYPQEHATHYTDTVDYFFDQKWGPRLSSGEASTLGTAGEVMFL